MSGSIVPALSPPWSRDIGAVCLPPPAVIRISGLLLVACIAAGFIAGLAGSVRAGSSLLEAVLGEPFPRASRCRWALISISLSEAKPAALVQFQPANFIKAKVKTCNKVVGFFRFSFFFFLLEMSSGKTCRIFQNLGEHRAPLFLISCVVFNCYYA